MSKSNDEVSRNIANKLVERYAKHESSYIQPTENSENDKPIKHHVYNFNEFGYAIVGADSNQKTARNQLVDFLTAEIESENLVLSSEITASL